MNISEFNLLSKKTKALRIQKFGKEIDRQKKGYYIYILYSLDHFFVETIVRERNKSKIIEINTFIEGTKLSYYTIGLKL